LRNWYNRKYLVLVELIAERRGRTFERKLAETEDKGYKLLGDVQFYIDEKGLHGVATMVKKSRSVNSKK